MASEIPALPGTYLLLIELTIATDVKLSNKLRASPFPAILLHRVGVHMDREEFGKLELPDICDEPKCNDGT